MTQSRKPRSTFQTAHDFYRQGFYEVGPEHWLTYEDQRDFINSASIELQKLIKEQFLRTGNLEYAILKAHLIVEQAITVYIKSQSRAQISSKLDFTFAKKLEIAYLMGLGVNDPLTLPSIERLNQIRNQVAHTFVLDRVLVDELLRINSAEYDEFQVTNDRQRVRQLRQLCAFISGKIVGTLSASVEIEKIRAKAARSTLAG